MRVLKTFHPSRAETARPRPVPAAQRGRPEGVKRSKGCLLTTAADVRRWSARGSTRASGGDIALTMPRTRYMREFPNATEHLRKLPRHLRAGVPLLRATPR